MSWDYYWANDPTHHPFKSSTWNCSDEVDDELWGWMESISKAIEQRLKNEMEDDDMPLRYKKEIGMHITKESIPEINQELTENNVTSFMWDVGEEKLTVCHNGVQKCFDFGERIHITPNKVSDTGTVFYDVYPARVAIDGEIFEKIYLAPNVDAFHIMNCAKLFETNIGIKTVDAKWYQCKFENAILVFDDNGQFIQLIDRDKDSPFGNVHQALLENGYKRVEFYD